MLYALVDYSNKKRIFDNYFAEEILGEVKILIPKFNDKNCSSNSRKFLRKIGRYNVQNVVLNDELNKNEKFCKILMENKKYIITGYRIGKVLLLRILKEISTYTKCPLEKLKIVLLMNEYSIENIELIECISKEVKQLSIVSHNYTKYEKTATRLFENYGYTVKLYGTNVKIFKRDNVVVNMDFKEEIMQGMLFYKEAIVVSLNEKINNLKRNFNGIIINDVDILGEGIPCENFRKLAVCEAKIYKPLRKINDNERIFLNEKYKINGYIGKNGRITQEEFEKLGKNYT